MIGRLDLGNVILTKCEYQSDQMEVSS